MPAYGKNAQFGKSMLVRFIQFGEFLPELMGCMMPIHNANHKNICCYNFSNGCLLEIV